MFSLYSVMEAAESNESSEHTRRRGCTRSNRAARKAAEGYWGLIAAGEPFRLLFPVGVLIGICGVMMWPAYVWGWLTWYPGVAHARVMVEGFLGSFVVGFLGTALPRLLGVPRVTIWETVGFSVAAVTVAILHGVNTPLWGDLTFFCLIGTLVLLLAARVFFRKDTPPPAFVLAGMGLICAMVGSLMLVAGGVAPNVLPSWALPCGRLLLYQGFILLPVMGIGAFLLPRFFGLPNRQHFPESLELPRGWVARAFFATTCGLAILGSFALEIAGFVRAGYGLRAAVVLLYFFREVPHHRAGLGGGTLALGLRITLVAIPSGYICLAVFPERAFTFLHVVFITGFSLLTLIVASRVVLGHSGQSEKFHAPLWPVLVMTAMVTLAMLTRVTADWMPDVTLSHYAYAALAWTVGAGVWALAILPGVMRADDE